MRALCQALGQRTEVGRNEQIQSNPRFLPSAVAPLLHGLAFCCFSYLRSTLQSKNVKWKIPARNNA